MYYYYKLLRLEKMELKSDSYVSATDDSCKDFQVLDELILNPSLLSTIICIIYFMNKKHFSNNWLLIFGMFVKKSMYFRVFAILIKAIY